MCRKIVFNLMIMCCFLTFFSNVFSVQNLTNRRVIIRYHTHISKALEKRIKQSFLTQKSKDTLYLLNNALSKDPNNTILLYKKASIYADQGDWNKTLEILNRILLMQPNHEEALKLKRIVCEKLAALPHNEIGADIDEAHVSDLWSYWNYSSIHYYRLTDIGKFGGRINYAHRYSTTAIQYQLEAYPQLLKNVYAALNFGYSHETQILYPSYQYMMEVYVSDPYDFEYSLGQGGSIFPRFSNQKIFNYTGSIGKTIDSYYVWVRPHYYTPTSTGFYEIGARKFFCDTNDYISIVFAGGRLPDLGDVPPLDQMVVVSQLGVSLNGQFAVNKDIFVRGGVGFVKQKYPSGLRRQIGDVSLGLVFRF